MWLHLSVCKYKSTTTIITFPPPSHRRCNPLQLLHSYILLLHIYTRCSFLLLTVSMFLMHLLLTRRLLLLPVLHPACRIQYPQSFKIARHPFDVPSLASCIQRDLFKMIWIHHAYLHPHPFHQWDPAFHSHANHLVSNHCPLLALPNQLSLNHLLWNTLLVLFESAWPLFVLHKENNIHQCAHTPNIHFPHEGALPMYIDLDILPFYSSYWSLSTFPFTSVRYDW